MTISERRIQEQRGFLLTLVKPGDTVYCTLRHVSRSGMLRVIDLHIIKDGDPVSIGYRAAALLGLGWDDKKAGVRISGCGMDMGFALVYDLSSVLFPDGFGCIGEKCPSNDHCNGDRDHTPHHEPHGLGYCSDCGHYGDSCKGADHWHKSGGYALRHRWI